MWEAALADSQRPRILLSHCLKPVASENHEDVKTLAATCKESRAVVAKYHEECQAQAREASRSGKFSRPFPHPSPTPSSLTGSPPATYTTHVHPATDICLARTSWFCMLGQRALCPRIYKTLQRVMVPSKRWLEVVLHTSTVPRGFGLFARLLRSQFGTHITEITMLLPELPQTALWDLEGEPRRNLKRLPEESVIDWDGWNAVPRELFWFWTPGVMARFEASYVERVGRFRVGLAEELYSGECEQYVRFADAIDPAVLRGASSDSEGVNGNGVEFFESLSDRHFLFELRHSWRFAFGDRLSLPVAHIRGQDVWRFLEGGHSAR